MIAKKIKNTLSLSFISMLCFAFITLTSVNAAGITSFMNLDGVYNGPYGPNYKPTLYMYHYHSCDGYDDCNMKSASASGSGCGTSAYISGHSGLHAQTKLQNGGTFSANSTAIYTYKYTWLFGITQTKETSGSSSKSIGCGTWDFTAPTISVTNHYTTINTSPTISCSDNLTGVTDCPNGSSYKCPSGVDSNLYTIWIGQDFIHDGVGNKTSTNGKNILLKCDGVGPTGCRGSIGSYNWNKTSVTVTGTGCNGGASGDGYCESKTVTSNGTHCVTCYDGAGNSTSNICSNVSGIDDKAPICQDYSLKQPDSDEYVRTGVSASVGCSDPDPASGCTETTYYGTIYGNGSITIADKAGHTTACGFNVKRYDTSGPTTTIEFGAGYENNSSTQRTSDAQVPVIITATDSGAGVNRICYRLAGATEKAETCVSGNKVEFNITANGETTIYAKAYDNAKDFSGGDYVYTTGNEGATTSKVAYIDRTKPTITLDSLYDTVTEWNFHNSPWVNKAQTVNITGKDASGIDSIEWIWTLDGSDTEVSKIWGAKNKNKTYDESNTATEVLPATSVVGETSVNLNNVNRNDVSYTSSVTNPITKLFNDEIYLHVRVCDNAFAKNTHKQPNCSTAVYGPIKFDNTAPTSISISREGVTGFNSANWTALLEYVITGSDVQQSGKDNAGLDTVELFFDVDYPHSNTVQGNAQFSSSPYAKKENCNYNQTCSYTMNFKGIYNIDANGNNTTKTEQLEDGVRWMGVKLTDKAGNVSKMIVSGPYRWDTKRPVLSDLYFSQDDSVFEDVRE